MVKSVSSLQSFEISRSPKRDGLKRNAVRELRGSGGTTPLLSLLGVKEMVVRVYSSRQKDRMEAKVLRGKDLEVVEAWKGRLKFEVGLSSVGCFSLFLSLLLFRQPR